jgi:hypothetical protein
MLYRVAGRRLYQAKQEGGNQLVVEEPGAEEERQKAVFVAGQGARVAELSAAANLTPKRVRQLQPPKVWRPALVHVSGLIPGSVSHGFTPLRAQVRRSPPGPFNQTLTAS